MFIKVLFLIFWIIGDHLNVTGGKVSELGNIIGGNSVWLLKMMLIKTVGMKSYLKRVMKCTACKTLCSV